MIRAADYRARAEHCARSAKAAQDDYHRKNFQKLAEMWSEMAAKAESRERSEQRRVEEALKRDGIRLNRFGIPKSARF